MVEFDRRATVARALAAPGFALGSAVTLDADAAHHLRVRRLAFGARVGVFDGAGHLGAGTLVRLGRTDAVVALDEVWTVPPPPAVHLLVPVADRDRMLWLAEKCAELAASSWRPVMWRRSGSVSPRGEGTRFRDKVRARMVAALAQSGGAWLPQQCDEVPLGRAIADAPPGLRVLLDPAGAPLLRQLSGQAAPVTIAVGPEGGTEEEEVRALVNAGFVRSSIGESILRFETAAVAALATVRAALTARASADAAARTAAGDS
jgi:16S rRNA (uracil1498-N3)-methyltransferase